MAAQERIAAMVDPALTALRHLVDTADQDSVRLSAIKDILDRAGYKPREKVDQNVKQTIEVRYADSPAPGPNAALPAAAPSSSAANHQ